MDSPISEPVFVTDNLKLAGALSAAGFIVKEAYCLDEQGKPERVICEIEPKAHGIKADRLNAAFLNREDVEPEVNAIIEARGITPYEYALIAFQAARAGLHNRSTLLHIAKRALTVVVKHIGGKQLIYKAGTPKEEIKNLINAAQ